MKRKFNKSIIGIFVLAIVCAMSLLSTFSTSARLQQSESVTINPMDSSDNHVIGKLDKEEYFDIYNGVYRGLTNEGIEFADSYDELHVYLPDGVYSYAHIYLSYRGVTEAESGVTLYDYRDKITRFYAKGLTEIRACAFKNFCNLEIIDMSQSPLTIIGDDVFDGINISNPDDIYSYTYNTKTFVFLPSTLEYFATGSEPSCNIYLVCPDKDVKQSYISSISDINDWFINNDYQRKLTYAVGIQINCTDNQSKQVIYTEKTIVGESGFYFVDGQWIKDAFYHSITDLPTLPSGWVWQDDSGNELNETTIKQLLLQAQSENEVMTLNAKAVRSSTNKEKSVVSVPLVAGISSGATVAVCGVIAGVVILVMRKRKI